jgi:hypothetical protein
VKNAHGVLEPVSKLRRCSLSCAEFGQCKAAMHGKPSECAAHGVKPCAGTCCDCGKGCATDGALAAQTLAETERFQHKVAKAICPRCKVDRFKEPCPGPLSACPMVTEAKSNAGVGEVPRG